MATPRLSKKTTESSTDKAALFDAPLAGNGLEFELGKSAHQNDELREQNVGSS